MATSVFVDVLGGEATDQKAYIAALPVGQRDRASERAEERAELVHNLVRDGLRWARLLLATTSVAVVLGIGAAVYAIVRDGNIASGAVPIAVGVGATAASVIVAVLGRIARRRKRSIQ
ncbi:MAG: hypothetical protein NTX33_00030 [Propionibacteriales bacterium]|nr:hypothetical protein [Propionibacteriales bacterium]